MGKVEGKMDIEIMPDKKYLIIGGYIISETDRQTHYVNAHTLRRLYNLPLNKCFLAESHDKILIENALHLEPKLTILRPRYNGNYTLE